jgi:hypothetical protein
MIERGTHRKAVRALKKMPGEFHILARPEVVSPKPGRRFGFLGDEVVIDRLEISIRGGRNVTSHAGKVGEALLNAGLLRKDQGKGGMHGPEAPLQIDGSHGGPNGTRIIIFGPAGVNILQTSMTRGAELSQPNAAAA